MTITCPGCSTTWTGLRIAHCGACHQTFSCVAHFDSHRAPNRGQGTCKAPSSVLAKHGHPAMRLNEHGVWVGAAEKPKFWT